MSSQPLSAPRTVLSAISRVMVSSHEPARNIHDSKPISNWRLDRSSNLNENGLNDRYIELNNILREQEHRGRLSNLVSECLFLDQTTNNKHQGTTNMKWANATQKSLAGKIGNILKYIYYV